MPLEFKDGNARFIQSAHGNALKVKIVDRLKNTALKTYLGLRRRAINPIKPKPAISIA